MIKAVIFDFGGILGLKQDPLYVEKICSLTGLEQAEFETIYRLDRHAYDSGDIDGEEYWSSILARKGLKAERGLIEQLINYDYLGWTRDREEMIELALRLKNSGYKIAILSNMPYELGNAIYANKEWLKEFDHVLFSAELKMSKPGPEFYLHCLELLDVAPEESLFIDDTYENIEAANSLGIRGYWYRDGSSDLTELEGLLKPLLK